MREKNSIISICITLILIFTCAVPSFAADKRKKVNELKQPKIGSKSAVLYCENTGETLFDKGGSFEFSAGNLSKLMTAITGLQKLSKDGEVTVADVSDDTDSPVQNGEILTVSDLLHAVLMTGSDEACQALATSVSEQGDDFTSLMNSTAENIGCKHTKFSGPTGSDKGSEKDETDYGTTTVDDLVKVGKVTMAEKNLSRIALTDNYLIKDKNSDRQYEIKKNNFFGYNGRNGIIYSMENKEPEGEISSLLYTNNNGLRFIIAIHSKDEEQLKKDAFSLIEYGKKKVRGHSVIGKDQCAGKVRVKHGAKTGIKVYATADGRAYLPKEASKSLVGKRLKTDDLEAPVKKGDIVGNCEILVADEVVNVVPLYAGETVKEGWLPSYLGISNRVTLIICFIIAVFVSLIIVRCINRIRYRRKKKKLRAARAKRLAREQLREEIKQEKRRQRERYH